MTAKRSKPGAAGPASAPALRVELQPGAFIFATYPPNHHPLPAVQPLLMFYEREGVTLIVSEPAARQAAITGRFLSRMITLKIPPQPPPINLLARATAKLAAAGIPAQIVSAFHHDYLFVQVERADEAMNLLSSLAEPAT